MTRGRTKLLGHVSRETLQELREHHTRPQIAAMYGVNERTLDRHLARLGLSNRNGRYKNDPEWLAKVEAMLDDGMSYNEISRTLGCSIRVISDAFPGRGWTVEQTAEYCAAVRDPRAAHILGHATLPSAGRWPTRAVA